MFGQINQNTNIDKNFGMWYRTHQHTGLNYMALYHIDHIILTIWKSGLLFKCGISYEFHTTVKVQWVFAVLLWKNQSSFKWLLTSLFSFPQNLQKLRFRNLVLTSWNEFKLDTKAESEAEICLIGWCNTIANYHIKLKYKINFNRVNLTYWYVLIYHFYRFKELLWFLECLVNWFRS